MTNVEQILEAAQGWQERIESTVSVEGYVERAVLALEFQVRIGSRRQFSPSRPMTFAFAQFDVDCMARDLAARAVNPKSSVRVRTFGCAQARVIVRFPYGNKNHLTTVCAWLDDDGSVYCNESNVVNNRHARVIGWADELAAKGIEHNSGWTGGKK
jgi:hypothetical protein